MLRSADSSQKGTIPMHVCLFDIDGTLISSGGAGKAAIEEAIAQVFGIPHAIEKMSLSGRTDRGIVGDVFRMCGIPNTEGELAASSLPPISLVSRLVCRATRVAFYRESPRS